MELTRFLSSCLVFTVFKVLSTEGLPADSSLTRRAVVTTVGAPVDIQAPVTGSLVATAQLSGVLPTMPEMPDMETAKAWLSSLISKGQSAYSSAKDKVVETYHTYSTSDALPAAVVYNDQPSPMVTPEELVVPADSDSTVQTVQIMAVQ